MKPILNFQIIESYDPRVISIIDTSIWEHLENKPSIIEIKIPGSSSIITHYFQKNSINSFNSVNLELSCADSDCGCDEIEYQFLPDGVYEITLKGSPDTFFITKKYLQTTTTRLSLDKKYLKALSVCSSNKKLIENLNEIYNMIEIAEANVRMNNVCQAQDLLYLAQDKLNSCNTECNGCK